jgi:hypothetical protein
MRDLQIATEELVKNCYSLVIAKNGSVIVRSKGKGVRSLFEAIDKNREEIAGSSIADRVIGKAAAMLCVYGRVKAVYTPVASESAIEILRNNSIHAEAEKLVPFILNANRTDMCPVEKLTSGLDLPEQVVNTIRKFLNKD